MTIELANAFARTSSNRIGFAGADGPLRARLDSRIAFHPLIRPSARNTWPACKAVLAALRGFRPDIVHANEATIGFLCSCVARACGLDCRFVVTHHALSYQKTPKWLGDALVKVLFDHYIAISPEKQRLLRLAGFSESKIHLIPNFIDLDHAAHLSRESTPLAERLRAATGNGAKLVVTSGRLIKEKRFDLFVHIMGALGERMPGQKIIGVIMGTGPVEPRLRDQIQSIRATNVTILLAGYQANVFPVLSMADAFCASSIPSISGITISVRSISKGSSRNR